MTRENALKICLKNETRIAKAKSVMPYIYEKIYQEAMLGKGAFEMMWQYTEEIEAIVLHWLKEDGYNVEYVSLEPIVVRISWI